MTSPKKDPVTTKDIAHLYTNLQTMIANVPPSPSLEREESPLNRPKTATASPRKETDCPCHHTFVSTESEYCALCDEKIPILAEIQKDRQSKDNRINELRQTLSYKQDLVEKHQDDLKQLGNRIEQVNENIAASQEENGVLKKDIGILKQKLDKERQEVNDARKAKATIENELEELSQKLFEEANGMVANERQAKHRLEARYNRVQEELKMCKEKAQTDELQLKELKSKLGLIIEEQPINNSSHVSLKENESRVGIEKSASTDLSGLFKTPQESKDTFEDELVLNEFKEFVYMGEETMSIRKLYSSCDYMKNSLSEDIEPCLRFGTQTRLSTKKLCDAISMDACFIEETPYGFAQDQAKRPSDVPLKISALKNMTWYSSAPSKELFCQACGRDTKELPYRFRISLIDDWACIDRFCRDRLVSVCEFYVFIRNIRQGYYSGRTISDLFRESVRLKLQMFYARVGELSQALFDLGIREGTIGYASEPNMIIPPPLDN